MSVAQYALRVARDMTLTRPPAISTLRVYVLNPQDVITPTVVAILSLGCSISNDLVRVCIFISLLEADRSQHLIITAVAVSEPAPLGCAIGDANSPEWRDMSVFCPVYTFTDVEYPVIVVSAASSLVYSPMY